jgi:hypothetical protein
VPYQVPLPLVTGAHNTNLREPATPSHVVASNQSTQAACTLACRDKPCRLLDQHPASIHSTHPSRKLFAFLTLRTPHTKAASGLKPTCSCQQQTFCWQLHACQECRLPAAVDQLQFAAASLVYHRADTLYSLGKLRRWARRQCAIAHAISAAQSSRQQTAQALHCQHLTPSCFKHSTRCPSNMYQPATTATAAASYGCLSATPGNQTHPHATPMTTQAVGTWPATRRLIPSPCHVHAG